MEESALGLLFLGRLALAIIFASCARYADRQMTDNRIYLFTTVFMVIVELIGAVFMSQRNEQQVEGGSLFGAMLVGAFAALLGFLFYQLAHWMYRKARGLQ